MSWTRYTRDGIRVTAPGRFLGNLLSVTFLTANATYTTPANCNRLLIEMVGAGGGGAGAVGSAANVAVGSGGGSGAYVQKIILKPNTTYAVVCGIAGTGGAGTNPGNAGSNTTVGSTLLIARGESGGLANINAITFLTKLGGAGGIVGATGDVNVPGENGFCSYRNTVNTAAGFWAGAGGTSAYGAGGPGTVTAGNGNAGTGFGAGGGGACGFSATTSRTGRSGPGGLVIIYAFT